MKRKPSPQWPCPICGRLWWTYADADLCAELNIKEEQAKARKLTHVDKLNNKELETLTESNKIE